MQKLFIYTKLAIILHFVIIIASKTTKDKIIALEQKDTIECYVHIESNDNSVQELSQKQ